ncbi:MAG TPA: PKD domain-containing protein, partial [Bacteroidales bacterium]|nr:PKD domain-containing protein [Bacteroidales bacterium]
MKKYLFSIIGMVILWFPVHSQQTNSGNVMPGDTANFPYWIRMMQDPSVNFFKVQRAFNLYWQNRPVTRGHGWKPFKRWEYMMQSRINPDGTRPPADAVYKAYEAYKQTNRSLTGNWISQGPSQIPLPGPAGYEGLGRLNVVGFHPTDANKIFAGSPSGGLWQSTDGGNTWVSYTDGQPTLGVSAIVVDKVTPSTIYIGTGDRDAGDAAGMGVFKSTDGGVNWAASNTGMGNQTVGKIIQHPNNNQILIAAASSGVYRSTNAGATWTLSKAGDFKDVVFKPGNVNIVYATASAMFYRSTDNGVTFTQITSGLPTGQQRGAIAVTPGNSDYVYFLLSDNTSGYNGVYRSTDGGLNFTTRSTTPNILDWSCDGSGTGGQGWYDLAIAADPNSPNTIYVGGVDVWKSTDGGQTWAINSHWYGGCGVPAVHADTHFLGFNPVDGKLYAGDDGGIWETSTGGVIWTDHTVGMTIGQIYKIGQSQSQPNMVINGFQDNGSYTFLGSDWEQTGGGDGMECAIDPGNSAYTYYTVYYGDIYRRYNNSNELHIAGNGVFGITESGAWVTPFLLRNGSPEVMFVGYKNIWRCTNVKLNNLTWDQISDNLGGSNGSNCSVLENCDADPNILYVAREDHKLFRTDDCMDPAPVWVNLTSYQPDGNAVTDLETSPTDPNVLYLTAGNKVYKSLDKGVTWSNISGTLPAVHINTIAYYKNAQEGLYIGTDAGVYYKDQFTGDWIPYSQGLPANGRVTELEIYYDNDSVSRDYIHGSTYGRGLWGSDMYHTTPVADFTADQTTVPVGCPVNFTDLSSGVPTSWVWTFQGGTPSTSTVKNPAGITYSTPGVYPVKMKIANEFGSDSLTKTNYITVSGTLVPAVDFTSDKTGICVGDTVRFTDETINCPSSWSWSFNPTSVTYLEGTFENSENPVVRFNAAGPYDVTLTAYNFAGSGTLTKYGYIRSGGLILPFDETFEQGLNLQHWTIDNPDNSVHWDTITVGGTTPGSKAAWINFYSYPTIGARDLLISPAFDLSGYSTVSLSFEHAYAQRSTLKDSLIVKVSADCGSTWTRILSAGPDGTPQNFSTHSPTTYPFVPVSAADWCNNGTGADCYVLDLTPWAGSDNVKIGFESYNRHGNNLFIDNVSLTYTVGVPEVKTQGFSVSVFPNPSNGIFTVSVA